MDIEYEPLRSVYNLKRQQKKIRFVNEVIQIASRGIYADDSKRKKQKKNNGYNYYTIKYTNFISTPITPTTITPLFGTSDITPKIKEIPIRKTPYLRINPYNKMKKLFQSQSSQVRVSTAKSTSNKLFTNYHFQSSNSTNNVLKGIQPKTTSNKMIKLHLSNEFCDNNNNPSLSKGRTLSTSFSSTKLINVKYCHKSNSNNYFCKGVNRNGNKNEHSDENNGSFNLNLYNNNNNTHTNNVNAGTNTNGNNYSNISIFKPSFLKKITIDPHIDTSRKLKPNYNTGNKSTSCSSFKFLPVFSID